jgi:prepilin-type N-terminal cleavage/methylation domain-containing protein
MGVEAGEPMKEKGFTLTELVIALAVFLLLVGIALPIYSRHTCLRRQQDAKVQLSAIVEAQQLYRLRYGTYSCDTASLPGWKEKQGRYTFRLLNATPTSFKAEAIGNIDIDQTLDIWTVDEIGNLINIVCDIGLK